MKHGFVSAKLICEKLQDTIKKARKKLAEGQSLAVLHYLPDGTHILLEALDSHGQALISLSGRDVDGNRCTVIVHANSVQLVLKVVTDEPQTNPVPDEMSDEILDEEPDEESDEIPDASAEDDLQASDAPEESAVERP